MVIPYQELRPETLRALIEDFVSRDGAVHGHTETTLEQKVSGVMAHLRSGKAVVVYDQDDETCSIVEKRSLAAPPGEHESRILREDPDEYPE